MELLKICPVKIRPHIPVVTSRNGTLGHNDWPDVVSEADLVCADGLGDVMVYARTHDGQSKE